MTYLKVFTDTRELMEPLNAEEKGRLFEAMLSYAMDETETILEGNERFIWPAIRRTIDQEAAAYENKVEANREKGRKGAKARWNKEGDSRGHTGHSDSMAEDSRNSQEQEQEQEQYQDHEQKEDQYQEQAQEYVYDQEQPSGADTHIPERGEIEAYCRERKNGIDPDYFYDYYSAAGWQVGQHPVRDWKALVRTWEKRDMQRGPLADTVRSVLDMAQAKRRDRQRNTLLNYKAEPFNVKLEDIAFDINEL